MFRSRALPVLAFICLAIFFSVGPTPARCELQDHGPHGEYFHDTATGLYWLDPDDVQGQTRATMDRLPAQSGIWAWATSAQVEALDGQVSEGGVHLDTIIGPRQSTISGGGPRWLGFYDGSGINGRLLQSDASPSFATVTSTDTQANAQAQVHGGWLVSGTDPAVACRQLENAGPDGRWFHDLDTGFYWFDPSFFSGLSRAEVETWLTTHTRWRWATAEEIFALLGKGSVDDGPLTTVLGDHYMNIGNGSRWVGYYAQATSPDGIILQVTLDPGYHLILHGDTQAGAASMTPGAWLISETEPTISETSSLGDVKNSFR